MKENAIIVKPLGVEKIYVDFSNPESITDILNCSRVSTIHSEKTQEISRLLGFHIMGYVDREGDDINNRLACEISGYPYLGSSLLLFKTDDKWHELPLEEEEVEMLYVYLTEGKIIHRGGSNAISIDQYSEKMGINPPLPNFPADPECFLSDKYPDILMVRYDFSPLGDMAMFMLGEQLFAYADILVKTFIKKGDACLSSDKKYYLLNKMDRESLKHYVFIEPNANQAHPVLVEKAFEEILAGF